MHTMFNLQWFGGGCLLGLAIRFYMAHGDLSLVANPFFPIFVH
jgi:hypothetical protein